MEHLGCGFNGFGQLLPQEGKRCILSFVKIFPEIDKDSGRIHDGNVVEESASFTPRELAKFALSWSTVYVLSGN